MKRDYIEKIFDVLYDNKSEGDRKDFCDFAEFLLKEQRFKACKLFRMVAKEKMNEVDLAEAVFDFNYRMEQQ